jgi:anti-anti-sigma factor
MDVSERAAPFSILLEADGEQPRLVLRGEIDRAAVPEFLERIQDVDRLGSRHITLDMHSATLIDASSLGLIAQLAAAGIRIDIDGATGIVHRALTISGLGHTDNVTIY